MISSNSFGTNIEKILQEILVTRTKVDELLTEIRNMSTDQINRCNELVNKLLSILQVIDERTKDIENRYAKLISEKNRFVDLTEWNETVLPEIIDIFEEELEGYLTKVLSVEDICERFLVEQLENYKAEQNDTFELTHNVFKVDPDNEERMKNYVYGESVGYNWYSVKAQDDYLANDNSLLVVTKYDNRLWNDLNAIYKGAVIHETISFHPKYGSLHMVTNARERVVSSYTDQETNMPFFTNDIKLFDGFDGNFNELKGTLFNRSVQRPDRNNMKNKNDIKYSLLLRHKINDDPNNEPMEPRDYFIMKVRDIEPLETGKPNEYVIQRVNTTSDNIMCNYIDTGDAQTFQALRQNPLNSEKDVYMSENEVIETNLEDNDESLSLNKKVVKINKYNYYDNNLFMNISKKGLLVLLKYQYNNQSPRVVNDLAVYGLAYNFNHYIKNHYKKVENYDLLSNLVMRIMPPNYTNFQQSMSYLTDFPNMEDKGIMNTHERFQIVNTSNHGFLDTLTANELAIYYREPNTNIKLPNGTVLDRLINVRGNKQYHFLTRYNMQEYYDIFNMPLRYNNYYFFPYMRDLSESNDQAKLFLKTTGMYDVYKSPSYDKTGKQFDKNLMKGGFTNIHINWGHCSEFPDNTLPKCISNIHDDGHMLISFNNLYDTFYSSDYGKTWKRIVIDYDNSPIKDQKITTSNGYDYYNHGRINITKNGYVVLPIYSGKTSSNKNPLYIRSVDYGKTWTIHPIETPSSSKYDTTYNVECNTEGTIAAITSYNRKTLFCSADFGNTWKYVVINYNSSSYTMYNVYSIILTDPIDRSSYQSGGSNIKPYIYFNGDCNYTSGSTNTNYMYHTSMYEFNKKIIDGFTNGSNWNLSISTYSDNYSVVRSFNFTNDSSVPSYSYCSGSNNSSNFTVYFNDGYTLSQIPGTNISGNITSKNTTNPYRGTLKITSKGDVIWYENYMLYLDVGYGYLGNTTHQSRIKLDVDHSQEIVFGVNDNLRMIIYYDRRYKQTRMIKYNRKRMDYLQDAEYITSLPQKLGELSNLTSVDVNEIKEEVINRVMNYYEKQSNIYIGTLIQLPFSVSSSSQYYNKYKLCDGSELSKIEYPELYKIIGDKYNYGNSVRSGYFRLPDFRNRTFVGTDSEELIGSKIENCLPENMEFEVNFKRIDEQDMRSGVIVSNTEASNTRTTVLGGFENGMDRTKFSIDHSSTSQNTIGNMFKVDVYIRVK